MSDHSITRRAALGTAAVGAFGVATQPIVLTGKRETIAKKTYIRASKYPQAAFDKALAECKADPTWQTFVNDDTGHDVMIDQPQWLADVLLKVS
jgi:hypothetical protein